jgi:hypothetical protein
VDSLDVLMSLIFTQEFPRRLITGGTLGKVFDLKVAERYVGLPTDEAHLKHSVSIRTFGTAYPVVRTVMKCFYVTDPIGAIQKSCVARWRGAVELAVFLRIWVVVVVDVVCIVSAFKRLRPCRGSLESSDM